MAGLNGSKSPWLIPSTTPPPSGTAASSPAGQGRNAEPPADLQADLPVDERFPRASQPTLGFRPSPICWVGAHGGAGTSSMRAVVGLGVDCGRTWPEHPGPVVLVARTHAHGLECVRRIFAERGTASIFALVLVATLPVGACPRPCRSRCTCSQGS